MSRLVDRAADRHADAPLHRRRGAAAAAGDVQRAFAGHELAVRIGLHTGQPRVAETGYVGLDVPRAVSSSS
jgi:class 3 adenylate cyclase